jgi:hypothetical protein
MQRQVQLDQQKLDQAYSFGVMGNVFSALEWYAYRLSGETIKPKNLRFNNYNNFNSGNKKDLTQLKNQIITQIEIFKFSYLIYKKEHKKYEFPQNLTENDIIKEIEKWKNLIKNKSPENLKYYDSILNIIQGKSDISFVEEIKKEVIEKGGDPNTINPKIIMNEGAAILSHTQSLANNKNFIENSNKMVLDVENSGNEKLNKIGEDLNEKNKKEKELEEIFEKIANDLERVYVLNKKNLNNKIKLKFYKKEKSTSKLKEVIKSVEDDLKNFQGKKKEYEKNNSKYYYKNNLKEIKNLESHLDKLLNNMNKKEDVDKIFKDMKDILNEMNDDSQK